MLDDIAYGCLILVALAGLAAAASGAVMALILWCYFLAQLFCWITGVSL